MVDRGTALCKKLGITYPVVQAPMAGGACTPSLVAAVGEAGALGSFGFAYSSPEQIAADVAALRALSDAPFNANLFVFPESESPQAGQDTALAALQACPLYPELQVDPPNAAPAAPHHPVLAEQIEAVCAAKPAAVSFHFGLPAESLLARVRATGAAIGCTATSVADAVALEARGVDFIVAQGIEAGGHRGTTTADADSFPKSTLALVMEVSSRVSLPVIAAGGLMSGMDLSAAMRVGASGGQFGTAFLTTDESGQSALYRAVQGQLFDRKTVLTRAFSGRLARGVRNRFIDHMDSAETLPFPQQNTATGPLRAAARAQQNLEAQSLWAGTGFVRGRSVPAAELVQALVSECPELAKRVETQSN